MHGIVRFILPNSIIKDWRRKCYPPISHLVSPVGQLWSHLGNHLMSPFSFFLWLFSSTSQEPFFFLFCNRKQNIETRKHLGNISLWRNTHRRWRSQKSKWPSDEKNIPWCHCPILGQRARPHDSKDKLFSFFMSWEPEQEQFLTPLPPFYRTQHSETIR